MRLLILRHAKSARPPGVDDFDRALCEEGKAAAPLIGTWLSTNASEPALVLCSSAKRSKETLALATPHFRSTPDIRYEGELYLAGLPVLLHCVRTAPPLSPLMLVGHNPGLQELGLALLSRHQSGEASGNSEELKRKFPTAALVVIDFKITEWRALRRGSGLLAAFVRPKALLQKKDADDQTG